MRVLVACECSGVVRDAFRRRGHDAYSVDVKPAEVESDYHIVGDALDVIYGLAALEPWDLLIAHPPCTYLTKASACRMYPTAGNLDMESFRSAMKARDFFFKMLDAPVKRVAVENPTPLKCINLPKHDCVVQPYEHGHPYSKRTLLWLKNLSPLKPTQVIEEYRPYLPSNTGGRKRGQSATGDGAGGASRSRTFVGIADAMADLWG